MYLFSQMTAFLLVAFLFGVGAGYGLWRLWGERAAIEKYKAAERRLAEYIGRMEQRGR
jgi:hypothetical protein